MAPTDNFTGSTSLDFSQTAYDRMAYFALRPELYFDAAADVMPTAQSMPGSSVQFTIVNDLPIAATALSSESVDVDTQSLSDSTVSLTLAEYGNAVLTTAKLRGTSFIDIDPVVANVVGYNAGVSLDTIARSALDSGTNVQYASGLGALGLQTSVTTRAGLVQGSYSGSTLTPGNTISALDIRAARARLRSQNVPTFGGMYIGYVHPDIVSDLQGEIVGSSNLQGWRAPHVYAQPGEIWTGELGAFEGVRFIETPRAPIFQGSGDGAAAAGVYGVTAGSLTGTWTSGAKPTVGAYVYGIVGTFATGIVPVVATVTGTTSGSFTITRATTAQVTGSGTVSISDFAGTSNVYGTLVLGRQALAKAHSIVDGNSAYPHVVPGPITDRLRRFVPLGWYWLGAYKVFRQAALMRIESTSLLGQDVNENLGLATPFTPAIDLGETANG